MSKTLKKILIIIAAVLAVLAIAALTLYKIFVTPNVKVALTLLNAKEDISESFNLYINDEEKEILDYVSKRSGDSTYDATFLKSPLFEGTSAKLTTSGNYKSSVSKLSFNKLLSLDIYADKSNILINLPLFNGGLKIPLGSNSQESEKQEPVKSSASDSDKNLPTVIGFFNANNIDFMDFFASTNPELIDFLKQTNIKKGKSDTVKIGDTEKKADVYLIDLTKEDMQRLADIIEGYMYEKKSPSENDILEPLTDFAENNKIYLKIKNYNLYEIEIVGKNDNNYTISFSGNSNQFDTITYLKNGKAEITRTQTTDKNKTTNTVTQSGKKLLVLTRDSESTSFSFNYNETKIKIKATGMNISEDTIFYDDLEFSFGDNFSMSGEYSLTKRTESEDIEFDKSGKYLDVTTLSPEEWESISSSISNLLNRIPFF